MGYASKLGLRLAEYHQGRALSYPFIFTLFFASSLSNSINFFSAQVGLIFLNNLD